MKPESDRPVTIEDLLRLKRTEVPPPEFWSTFDRELRAKQLAALVEKRPWWQRLPSLFSGVSRFRVPIGATALLAITLLTVRYHNVPAPSEASGIEPAIIAQEEVGGSAVFATAEDTSSAAVSETVSGLDSAVENDFGATTAVAAVDQGAVEEGVISVETVAAAAKTPERDEDSPAARYIAANLAIVQAAAVQSGGRSLLESASGFEVRAMPARAAVEPLQQMTPPSDSRRSRLLTAMVSQASLDASMRATARAASRIEEERLYERTHRFGARGDQVNLKF